MVLTFVAGPDQCCGHGLLNHAASREARVFCRFIASLGDVSLSPAHSAAHHFTLGVLAGEFPVDLDRWAFCSKGAKWTGLQVLNTGHSQDGFLLNAVQSNNEFIVQEDISLVP